MLKSPGLFKQLLSLLLLFLSVSYSSAQKDTIRIFQYNLLNYGNSANTPAYKNPRLQTIIDYVKPDIFGANEIANSASYSQNILTNVLGNGWSKGTFVNTGNETQTNMLFWNNSKFALAKQQTVSHNLRDIIAFHLFYKDSNLAVTHDTIFLVVIVAHLKASQGSDEEQERAAETQTVVNYLNALGKRGNYIFMGDLNIYTSNELAYQHLVNNSNPYSKMVDPINRPGSWNNTSTFSDIHTQSTRSTTSSDGGVTGGLDDRFDIMLCSDYVINDSAGIKYLPGSYTAVGQDGQHFNKALNDGTNSSAPGNVITALYEMSDHLPIYADFVLTPSEPVVGIGGNKKSFDKLVKVVNPVDDQLIIYFDNTLISQRMNVSLFSSEGKKIMSKEIKVDTNPKEVDMYSSLKKGMYVLRLTNENGITVTRKIIKN